MYDFSDLATQSRIVSHTEVDRGSPLPWKRIDKKWKSVKLLDSCPGIKSILESYEKVRSWKSWKERLILGIMAWWKIACYNIYKTVSTREIEKSIQLRCGISGKFAMHTSFKKIQKRLWFDFLKFHLKIIIK